ncbi:protein of unknown function [Paenibacillus alvei]|uniref:Uncharacterized protein n=1 Tax=Paenibacillus alvei TaxID=44250 RepID=A0A383R7T9_PAEAL|nr:protein of unknown function [Paenibacillus alvei]
MYNWEENSFLYAPDFLFVFTIESHKVVPILSHHNTVGA